MSRRHSVGLAVAVVLVLSTGLGIVIATHWPRAPQSAVQPQAGAVASASTGRRAVAAGAVFERSTHLGRGATAGCRGAHGRQYCAGSAEPIFFSLPGSGAYRATITLSFQYKYNGTGTVTPVLRLPGGKSTHPQQRPLPPTTTAVSATVVYQAQLAGGRNEVDLSVTGSGKGTWDAKISKVLVRIDATTNGQ